MFVIDEIYSHRSPSFLSFGFPKNSVYHEVFNYNILRQSESGVQDILLHRRMRKKEEVCNNANVREPEDVSLGMKKLVSLFASLAAAFGLSIFIFCIESTLVMKTKNNLLAMKPDISKDKSLKKTTVESRFGSFIQNWDNSKKIAFLKEVENYCQTKIREES